MLLIILLLLFSPLAHADWETYAVEIQDGSITILSHESSIEDLDTVLKKQGLNPVSITRVTPKDLPANRADRRFWKKQGKKIVVDTDKKKDHEDALAQKESEKNAVYQKMGISKEEFEKVK